MGVLRRAAIYVRKRVPFSLCFVNRIVEIVYICVYVYVWVYLYVCVCVFLLYVCVGAMFVSRITKQLQLAGPQIIKPLS